MKTRTITEPLVWRIDTRSQVWGWLTIAVCIFSLIYILGELVPFMRSAQPDPLFYYCLIPFSIGPLVVVLIVTTYRVLFTRVVLTSAGIEYHTLGGSIFATWDETSQAGGFRSLLRGDVPIDGLYVQSSSRKRGLLLLGDFIPLSAFDPDWRNNYLGEMIFQHAPHLVKVYR